MTYDLYLRNRYAIGREQVSSYRLGPLDRKHLVIVGLSFSIGKSVVQDPECRDLCERLGNCRQ